ncbi:MAG: hypothetical protein WEE36_00580 [Acidimicrobiia bacterium]
MSFVWFGFAWFMRRFLAGLVMVVGAIVLGVTIAGNLFAVGPAFEEMIDDFRPWITDESIATLRADLDGLVEAVDSFQTEMAPALISQLGMSPEEFAAMMAEYPAVTTGLQVVPDAAAGFTGIIDLLEEQQSNFLSADEIPTEQLPATTVPWGFAIAGILAIAVGLAMLAGRAWAVAAVVLGALLVGAALTLSLLTKAGDADDLNAALLPVYTEEMVAGASGAIEVIGAMGDEMATSMMPGLAQALGMTPEQTQEFVQSEFPVIAGALESMPAAVGRFEGLVGAFSANLANYDTLVEVTFVPIVWTLIVSGALILVFGGIALLTPGQKTGEPVVVGEEPRVPVGV